MDTDHEFWKIMAWSITALWKGKWPTHDWRNNRIRNNSAGRPLCGDGRNYFLGFPFILRGDLDWFLKRMKLQNYGSAFPCNLCRCNLSDVPWNDLRRLALSLTTTWDDASWKAAHANCKCLLYRLDFFSFLTTSVDWLHTMHIGILQYVYASILTLLVYHELPGSPNDNIKTVMQFLRQYWKLNPTPAHFRYIRLSMFSVDPDEGYPKLKGRASEIKRLSKGVVCVLGSLSSSRSRGP